MVKKGLVFLFLFLVKGSFASDYIPPEIVRLAIEYSPERVAEYSSGEFVYAILPDGSVVRGTFIEFRPILFGSVTVKILSSCGIKTDNWCVVRVADKEFMLDPKSVVLERLLFDD